MKSPCPTPFYKTWHFVDCDMCDQESICPDCSLFPWMFINVFLVKI